jgi:ring-1,2-phenylacetyl-CoA epoxidase subunit PaaD
MVETIPMVNASRYALNRVRAQSSCPELYDILDQVTDPEVPVISIWELGVLQEVMLAPEAVRVVITPTYSGCPAMGQIETDIISTLNQAGYERVEIERRLSPAWTSDWLDSGARERLRQYGIAGPGHTACPQCGSTQTTPVSEFGSTACKALYRCEACLEPFDYFKKF